MRIAKSQQRRRAASTERWLWAAALLLIFGLGWLAGNGGWHRRLADWAARLWRDPHAAFAAWSVQANVPTLYLDLNFSNFEQLTTQRTRALESGAYLAEEAEVVPATLTLDNESVDVDVSLPEIEAAALVDERWPLAVTVRDGAALLDMHQATLWPVDETARFNLSYLATLRDHSIPATTCHYVNLTVNGANWGLYVMEEVPSTTMAALEDFSPESVVVYFDRRAYLEAQPVAAGNSFTYARIAVVPVVDGTSDDAALAAIRADVVRILRGVEQGTYLPSDAFDPQTLADFMALTMLWRGDFELDWRSLYLVYDPATQRFTPLGTGALPGTALPLSTTFTADPAIQRAYVQALVEFSRPEFLTAIQRSEDWRTDEAVLLGRADILTEYQARMRALVAPSRTLVAALAEYEGAWQLTLTNVIPFPVEVLSVDVGERAVLPLDPTWVAQSDRVHLLDDADTIILPAQTTKFSRPVVVRVPLTALRDVAPKIPEAVTVVTRIWGLDAPIVVLAEWGNE